MGFSGISGNFKKVPKRWQGVSRWIQIDFPGDLRWFQGCFRNFWAVSKEFNFFPGVFFYVFIGSSGLFLKVLNRGLRMNKGDSRGFQESFRENQSAFREVSRRSQETRSLRNLSCEFERVLRRVTGKFRML